MRLLPLASRREAARPLVPSGSPAGACLAALDAMSAHEMAGHLSGGLWLASGMPVLEFSTSLFPAVAVSPP